MRPARTSTRAIRPPLTMNATWSLAVSPLGISDPEGTTWKHTPNVSPRPNPVGGGPTAKPLDPRNATGLAGDPKEQLAAPRLIL